MAADASQMQWRVSILVLVVYDITVVGYHPPQHTGEGEREERLNVGGRKKGREGEKEKGREGESMWLGDGWVIGGEVTYRACPFSATR